MDEMRESIMIIKLVRARIRSSFHLVARVTMIERIIFFIIS